MRMSQVCRQRRPPCPCKHSSRTFSGVLIGYLNTCLPTSQASSCQTPTCQLFGAKHSPKSGKRLLQPAATQQPRDSRHGHQQCSHGRAVRAGFGVLTRLYHAEPLVLLEFIVHTVSLPPPHLFQSKIAPEQPVSDLNLELLSST